MNTPASLLPFGGVAVLPQLRVYRHIGHNLRII
jgi:hypothetical protein